MEILILENVTVNKQSMSTFSWIQIKIALISDIKYFHCTSKLFHAEKLKELIKFYFLYDKNEAKITLKRCIKVFVNSYKLNLFHLFWLFTIKIKTNDTFF